MAVLLRFVSKFVRTACVQPSLAALGRPTFWKRC